MSGPGTAACLWTRANPSADGAVRVLSSDLKTNDLKYTTVIMPRVGQSQLQARASESEPLKKDAVAFDHIAEGGRGEVHVVASGSAAPYYAGEGGHVINFTTPEPEQPRLSIVSPELRRT